LRYYKNDGNIITNNQEPKKEELMSNEQWVPIGDAAKILKVSRYKLDQLVTAGLVASRENIRDKRKKLIDIEQAKQVLGITAG
jgi:hypothetical protein